LCEEAGRSAARLLLLIEVRRTGYLPGYSGPQATTSLEELTMRIRICLLCCVTFAPVAVLADDPPPPPPQGVWVGKGQLGFLASQGNSEASSANAAIDMGMLIDAWEHKFHLGGLYGRSAGVVAAERWDTNWQSDYSFAPELFAFGALRYQQDLFSGFQYQGSQSAGAGYKIINSAATKLSAQAGVGYRELRPENLIKDDSGAVIARVLLPTDDSVVFTAGLDYSQAFTSTTVLSNKLLVEVGSGDKLITDALALTVKMSTRLALSLGYSLQDNSRPPAGLKKLDSVETANLVFSF
jgi:putative salt-induced outer membrane protein